MKLHKSLLVALTLLSGTTAFAAQPSGWYVGVGAGQTEGKDVGCGGGYAPVFADTTCSADNKDTGLKVFAGFQLNPNAALEFGWVDLGEATIKGTDSFFGTTNATWKADGLYVAGIGSIPVGSAASFFGKIGLFRWKADLKIDTDFGFASDDDSGTDLLFGIGASFNLGSSAALRLEWERFSDVGDSSSVGQSDVDMLSASLLFRF